MSVAIHRPLLETVPETEILDSSAISYNGEVDYPENSSDFEPQAQIAVQSSVLLTQLLECMRKLEISENKVQQLESKRNNEMKVIVSRLFFLESRLVKDKKRVETIINSKDTQIQDLESRLEALKHENHRIQQMIDCGDSAIGSLDYIPGVVMSTSLPLTEYESSKSRNFTDPDKRSVEGALLSCSQHQKCKRTNTDPGSRYQKRKNSHSRKQSPNREGDEVDEVDTAGEEKITQLCVERTTQTTPTCDVITSRVADAATSPLPEPEGREVRSYSNPDDPESAYQKTEDKDKVNERDLVLVREQQTDVDQTAPPPVPPRISMRKKSVSSPDIQKQLLSEIASQPTQSIPKSYTEQRLSDRNNNMENHWENQCLDNSDYFVPNSQQIHGETMITYPPTAGAKLPLRTSPLVWGCDSPTPTGQYKPPRPPKLSTSIKSQTDSRRHLETNLDDYVVPVPAVRKHSVPYMNVVLNSSCEDNSEKVLIGHSPRSPSLYFDCGSLRSPNSEGFPSLRTNVTETYFPRSPSPNHETCSLRSFSASPVPVSSKLATSGSMKHRRTGLLKKPKLYLRSYSTPNGVEYSESEMSTPATPTEEYNSLLHPTKEATTVAITSFNTESTTSLAYTPSRNTSFKLREKNDRAMQVGISDMTENEAADSAVHSNKPWTFDQDESTDDLINGVHMHFANHNNIRRPPVVRSESAPIYF